MKKFFSKGVLISLFAAFVMLVTVLGVNSMKRHVTLVVDGKEQVIQTYKQTVSEFLAENGITVANKDKIDRNDADVLTKEDKIEIIRAVPVTLFADGATQEFMTPEETVEDFLLAENIVLGEIDKLSVARETEIEPEMEMTIVRVTKETVTESVVLTFATEEKKDATILKGQKKTTQEGAEGEKVLTKERTYEDGVLVSEELVAEEVTRQPVDKVIAIGTKVIPPKVVATGSSNTASRGSIPSELSYSKAYPVVATAYAGDGITASGAVPVRNPGGWSTIAVDRSIIPLGTRVDVENYGYAIAQDVGGAIKGNKIDVFLNSDAEAFRWGRRTVMIYILN
ncbi:MAG TPA: 3D domain-containing protein [Clostridiaceae bacterium]|nr:3D domain-containing protein [Clostridiaceae bacterium]